MKPVRAWLVCLVGVLRRDRGDEDFASELEAHLQLHVAQVDPNLPVHSVQSFDDIARRRSGKGASASRRSSQYLALSPPDPAALAWMAAGLLVVAVAATWGPSRPRDADRSRDDTAERVAAERRVRADASR